MSLNSARISLFNHLNTNWATTPIVFQGQKTGDEYVKRADPWIFAYILWGTQFQKSTGAPSVHFSIPGTFTIRMFIRHGDGIALKDQYTDSLFALFRGKTIDNMIIQELRVDRDDDNDEWQIREVSISFILRTYEDIS